MSEKKHTLEIPLVKDTQIEDLRLLKHHEGNPNRMSIKQKEQLWCSLQHYGWLWPIVTDSNGVVADGEQRIDVCIAHGEFYGPVLRRPLTESERLLLGQKLNKLKGQHNKQADEVEYGKIDSLGGHDDLAAFLDAIGEKLPGGLHEMGGSNMMPESYELIVECKDETEQKSRFEECQSKGWKVRVLNL
jgi:hypothetical protein